MSENHEQRLSDVEREQVRQGERLSRIETDVGKIGAGVDKLLERPKGLSWGAVGGTIVATAGGLLSVAAVGWWLIGSSPAVRDLEKEVAAVRSDTERKVEAVERRVDKLDDPEIGRVPRVERKVHELDQWAPRVTRY